MVSVSEITDVGLIPLALDFEERAVIFARAGSAAYASWSFLDERSVGPDADIVAAPFALVDESLRGVETAGLRWVFHSAFCCSTLLSRALQQIPKVHVVREPYVLAQAAAAVQDARQDAPSILDRVLRLLARAPTRKSRIVVKPGDACGILAPALLANDTTARALFCTSSLRSFLLAALKSPARRRWVRLRLPRALRARPYDLPGDLAPPGDAESGAVVWLERIWHFERTSAAHPDRVGHVDGVELPNRRAEILLAATGPLRLGLTSAGAAEIASGPVFDRYAKDPGRPYGSADRRAEHARLEAELGTEIDAGIAFARELAGTRCRLLF